MHILHAIARRLHHLVYILGPGLIPRVLAKYTAACSWLLFILCLAASLGDLRRHRLTAALWIATGVLLFLGFRAESSLDGLARSGRLAWAVLVSAALLAVLSLLRRLASSQAQPDPRVRQIARRQHRN